MSEKGHPNMAEADFLASLSAVKGFFPKATFSWSKDTIRQCFVVARQEESFTDEVSVSYMYVRDHSRADVINILQKKLLKERATKEQPADKVVSDWVGFKETRYNWCIMVYEHWSDEETRGLPDTNGAKLDGTSECFLRVYSTRQDTYIDSLESLVTYIKSTFLSSDNWYEIKIYKGNNTRQPFCRVMLKAEGEIWEGKLNG